MGAIAEEAVAPSMLSSLLGGAAPVSRPSPALVAVRRHTLDDTEPGKRSLNPGTPIRPVGKPRDFTAADKALIRRVHAYMNPLQLLGILNTVPARIVWTRFCNSGCLSHGIGLTGFEG